MARISKIKAKAEPALYLWNACRLLRIERDKERDLISQKEQEENFTSELQVYFWKILNLWERKLTRKCFCSLYNLIPVIEFLSSSWTRIIHFETRQYRAHATDINPTFDGRGNGAICNRKRKASIWAKCEEEPNESTVNSQRIFLSRPG